MRGSYPDPRRVNTLKGERGWLERQRAAQSRMAANVISDDPDSWRSIDAERRAAERERERLAMEDAERRRAANRRLRVSCPCCDSGAVSVERAEMILAALDKVPVNEHARHIALCEKDRRTCPVCDEGSVDGEMAERVVVALEKLLADRIPSVERLQILFALAMGVEYHGIYALRPANGAKYPRRARPVGDVAVPVAETLETAPAPREPTRKYVLPPHLFEE